MSEERPPIRPLKVGSIKNPWLRRPAIMLWFPILLILTIVGNILLCITFSIKNSCKCSWSLMKDFKVCWIKAKP